LDLVSNLPPLSPSLVREGEDFTKRGFAPLKHPAGYFPHLGVKSLSVSLYKRERLMFPPLKKGD